MSEVEKMYRNSGIEKHKKTMLDIETGNKVLTLDSFYPEFTAEKQLNIIKWLLKSYDIGLSQLGERIDTSLDGVNCISGLGSGDTFEESLAQAINDLWQDLTEEEKRQVKGILK